MRTMREEMASRTPSRSARLESDTARAVSRSAFALVFALGLNAAVFSAQAQRQKPTAARKPANVAARKAPATSVAASSITVKSEPKAVVWLDDVRRGVTDASGRLEIAPVSRGRHTLRVRAAGFGERTVPILPAQRGAVSVALLPTSDEAELAFQQAEDARERAATDEARHASAELYRRALALRPRFPAARIGLARVLLDLNDYDGALAEVDAARRVRRAYAEASVVEGRILRAQSQNEEAVAAYERALREARGFQPEAHTGLGIIYEEEGKYELAAAAFGRAIAQLSDTEPVLYELIGRTYERLEKYREAVAAYEKYLALAPTGKLAPAIQSVIEQLRKQAAEQDASQPFG